MQQQEGKSEEVAKAICGKLQADAEGRKQSADAEGGGDGRKQSRLVQSYEERVLVRELRSSFKPDKITEQDGGVLVKDVKLLATGTWTDSNVGTPLFYPESTLEKYAGNWVDYSLWSRHGGRVPRSITDKVGEIRNPRYHNDGKGGAVVGDLWLHGKTQASRDTIELIKAGIANFVSVEHGGAEGYSKSAGRYEAESLVFGGVAVVNQGACSVCTINNEVEKMELELGLRELDTELVRELQCAESDLPASAYAWVEDKEKKTTWHLPHHGKDGAVKCNCVRAALQAIGGARTGKPMSVPSSAVSHLKSHAKECGIETQRNDESKDAEQSKLAEAKSMELKELEAQLADAKKTIGELKDASAKKDAEIADLKKFGDTAIKQLETVTARLTDFENRITKIEKTPAQATQVIVEKELEPPAIQVIANKRTGEVYRE